MRALQKLVRNGNSTQVTIPRTVLIHLGWLPGEEVVVEVLEDKALLVRRPDERDFRPIKHGLVRLDAHPETIG